MQSFHYQSSHSMSWVVIDLSVDIDIFWFLILTSFRFYSLQSANLNWKIPFHLFTNKLHFLNDYNKPLNENYNNFKRMSTTRCFWVSVSILCILLNASVTVTNSESSETCSSECSENKNKYSKGMHWFNS